MWILAVPIGIVLFFILLLAVPVDLQFRAEKDVKFKSRVRVEWLFGLIGKDLERKKKKPEGKKPRKRYRKILGAFKSRKKSKAFLALLRTRGFIRRCLKYLRGVLRSIHIRELRLDVRFGTNDPADTGMIMAVVGPPVVFANFFSPCRIRVYPDFNEEIFKASFSGYIRIFPIQLVWHSLALMFSLTTIRAVKNMVVARLR